MNKLLCVDVQHAEVQNHSYVFVRDSGLVLPPPDVSMRVRAHFEDEEDGYWEGGTIMKLDAALAQVWCGMVDVCDG